MEIKGIEQVKKEAEERGYYVSDMKETEQKIRKQRNAWKRNFMTFVENILHDNPDKSVDKIVEIADKLADAVEHHLEFKFDDSVED